MRNKRNNVTRAYTTVTGVTGKTKDERREITTTSFRGLEQAVGISQLNGM